LCIKSVTFLVAADGKVPALKTAFERLLFAVGAGSGGG
jgi:hypothetical protein